MDEFLSNRRKLSRAVRHRREKLLDILREDMVATVNCLSDRLSVSRSTIRRDLDALEDGDFIERIHGGARLVQSVAREMDKRELPFYTRRDTAVAEKTAIAQAALDLLEPDQVIVLDASTTALYFAQAIPEHLSLTVVTHSAYIPVELAEKPDIQVISVGGILHPSSLCYLGLEAEKALEPLHAHRAFLGLKGLTLAEGCTDANMLEVQLKANIVRVANELIVLADHTKLGNIALASFAPLGRIRAVVTDEKADPEFIEALCSQDIEVIVAPIKAEATELRS